MLAWRRQLLPVHGPLVGDHAIDSDDPGVGGSSPGNGELRHGGVRGALAPTQKRGGGRNSLRG